MTRRTLPFLVLTTLACVWGSCRTTTHDGSTRHAAVASATPEATDIGIEVLRRGGNAIDAAIAVALAIGVSEPAGSGIGGQIYLLMCRPGEEAVVVGGSTRAPSQLPESVQRDDLTGRRATTVPSALAVLDVAHRRWGSGKLSWSELVLPAAQLAESDPGSGPFRAAAARRYGPDDLATRLPNLARTLRTIASDGAETFYRGAIARQIADDMNQNGGWLRLEDLADFPEPQVEAALVGTYRGYRVHTLPPPAGGWVALRALNTLEQLRPDALETDRTWLLGMTHALLDAHTARMREPVVDPVRRGERLRRHLDKETSPQLPDTTGTGETTHFSVVDGDGVMVAVSLSLNSYYGSKVAHPELGFYYNDYMREFVTGDPAHPFALAPDAKPLSSMCATILTQDGKPVLAVGSPGSRRIISAVVQVTSNWVDRGMGLAAAVAAPRIHVVPETRRLFTEQAYAPPWVSKKTLLALERSDLRVVTPYTSLDRNGLSPYFGGVHAVAAKDGDVRAAADPRRDGTGRVVALPARD